MKPPLETLFRANPVRREFLKGGAMGLVAVGVESGAGRSHAAAVQEGDAERGKMPLSKSRETWREALNELPVFDTHSHLNNPGVPIGAQNIWDIVHYFWFEQELQSVGYPLNAMDLPEAERVAQFVNAFHQTRNTVWALIVRETLRALYGVELSDASSVLQADEAVRSHAKDPAWPRAVLDRLQIRRVAVNSERAADFPGLQGVGVAVPLLPDFQQRVDRVVTAKDPRPAADAEARAVREDVAGVAARGWRGMRVRTHAFDEPPQERIIQAVTHKGGLTSVDIGSREAEAFLTHTLLDALGEHGMFAQFFLGIDSLPGCGVSMAVSDPRRITNLYPLFERYSCGFELVAGASGLNMDVTQAARIYPHVYAGGLWWYNFRNSTYQNALQTRIEALPAPKSVILASDARCVEWCYAKTLLVKWLLADFLRDQVAGGWINEADALWVAREWLHDAAARRYV